MRKKKIGRENRRREGSFFKLKLIRPWWSSGSDSASNAGAPGSIPVQGTSSHMLQLKILNATKKLT